MTSTSWQSSTSANGDFTIDEENKPSGRFKGRAREYIDGLFTCLGNEEKADELNLVPCRKCGASVQIDERCPLCASMAHFKKESYADYAKRMFGFSKKDGKFNPDELPQEVRETFAKASPFVERVVREKEPADQDSFDYIHKLVEDVYILSYYLCKSTTRTECLHAIATFVKLRTNEPLTSPKNIDKLMTLGKRVKEKLMTFFTQLYPLQSDGDDSSPLSTMKGFLDNYDKFKTSKFYRVFYKFLMYALSLSLFEFAGLTFEKCGYDAVQAQAIKNQHHMGVDFVHSLIETIVFICEQGQQIYTTGKFDKIFHSAARYEEWYELTAELITQSKTLASASTRSYSVEKFNADLTKAIEQGKAILCHARVMSDYEVSSIRRIYSELLLIRAMQISKQSVMKTRKAPFAMLIFGGSHIGKSQFQEMLFQIHAKAFDLPNTPEYKYSYNPFDEYLSGYRTEQWSILIDDVSFRKPDKCTDIDGSLAFLMQACTNAPVLTTQAHLDDKGKIPLVPKQVVASTNVPHLNAHAFFVNELAPRRRFPYCLRLIPKKEYCKINSDMIDSNKIPVLREGELPDYWHIEVHRIESAGGNITDMNKECVQKARFVQETCFFNIHDFVTWYCKTAKQHDQIQDNMMDSCKTMEAVVLCKGCYKIKSQCVCCMLCLKPRDACVCNVQMSTMSLSTLRSLVIAICEYHNELGNIPESLLTYVAAANMCFQTGTLETTFLTFKQMGQVMSPAELHCHLQIAAEYWSRNPTTFTNLDAQYIAADRELDEWWAISRWSILTHMCVLGFSLTVFSIPSILCAWFVRYFVYQTFVELYTNGTVNMWARFQRYVVMMYLRLRYGKHFHRKLVGYVGARVAESLGINAKLARLAINAASLMLVAGIGLKLYQLGKPEVQKRNHSEKVKKVLLGEDTFKAGVSLTDTVCEVVVAHKSDELVNKVKEKEEEFQKALQAAVAEEMEKYKRDMKQILDPELPQVLQADIPDTLSTGVRPQARPNERPPVWYKEDVELTSLDFHNTSKSWKGMSQQEVVNRLSSNCLHLWFQFPRDGNMIVRKASGFAVASHYILCNAHMVPDCDFVMSVTWSQQVDGINRNIEGLRIALCNVKFDRNCDLALIHVTGIPPFANFLDLFASETVSGCHNGIIVSRDCHGSMMTQELKAMRRVDEYYNVHLNTSFTAWLAHVDQPTEQGSCGSLYLMQTHYGPVIVGIHVAGAGGRVACIHTTKTRLQNLIKQFGHLDVQAGEIVLNAPSTNHTLGPLHPKSVLRYIERGQAIIYGSIEGFRANSKSLVGPTFIQAAMLKRGYTVKYGAPSMRGWEPVRVATLKLMKPKPNICPRLMKYVVRTMLQETLDIIGEDINMLEIYDNDTAMCGAPGVSYVDAINTRTSMGHPYNTTKRKFKIDQNPRDGYMNPFTMSDEVMSEIEKFWNLCCQGIRPMQIFSGSPKDEARSFEKIAAHKTRYFMASSMAPTFCTRKLLGSFARLIQTFKQELESAIGVVCQSTEWTEMYLYMTHFGEDTNFDGDFGDFDVVQFAELLWEATWFIVQLCKAAGYPDWALLAIQTLMEDAFYAIVKVSNDLYQMLRGIMPSGFGMTTYVNTIINKLLMRIVYCLLNPEGECDDFTDKVHMLFYGDDLIGNVSKDIPWFNHLSITEAFTAMGIKFTTGAKDTESKPYLSIWEITFLKRSFRFDPLLGVYVAPLAHESIEKMLTVNVKSKSVCAEAQAVDIIGSAIREYFFYGKEIFEEKRRMLLSVVDECELHPYMDSKPIPTWDDLVSTFWKHSNHKYAHYFDSNGVRVNIMEQERGIRNCSICTPKTEITPSDAVTVDLSLISSVTTDEEWAEDESSPERTSKEHALCSDVGGASKTELNTGESGQTASVHRKPSKINFNIFSQCCTSDTVNDLAYLEVQMSELVDEHVELLSLTDKQLGQLVRMTWIKGQYVSYKKFLLTKLHLIHESGHGLDILTPAQEQSIVDALVARFPHIFGRLDAHSTGASPDAHMSVQMDEEVTPIVEAAAASQTQVQTTTFIDTNEGDQVDTTPNIGADIYHFSTTEQADLENFLKRPVRIWSSTWNESDTVGNITLIDPWYAFLNNTKVKYKLNNFSWLSCKLHVKVVVNASPFYFGAAMLGYIPMGGYLIKQPVIDSGNRHLVQYSQLDHVWILPHCNKAGEIELPWIYCKNYVNVQSATDVQRLGRLFFTVYSQLASANGVSGTGVSIQVFAWATDVHLEGASIGLALQSDEYSLGPISGPASAVANVAGKLENVPIIGRFARATAIGAGAVSRIASIFGFSNTPNLKETDPYRPNAFPLLAGTDQKYPYDKLTLDPKNELSINAQDVGGSESDDLIISKFCAKESFVTSFTFSTTNAIDDVLFNTAVTPQMYAYNATTKAVYASPMSYGAGFFQFWRGGIKLRFKVVASCFHKGRIIISYDPSGQGSNNLVADATGTNAIFNTILDIEPDADVEVTIPYMQGATFQQTSNPAFLLSNVWQTSSFSFINQPNFFNGALTVRVVTTLTAPILSSTINVLVFAKCADDFELAVPRRWQNYDSMSLFPIQSSEIVLGPYNKSNPSQYHVNFGERVVSLRQLMQRMCLNRVQTLQSILANQINAQILLFNQTPLMYGYDPYGIDQAKGLVATTTTFKYNWAYNHPLSMISNCYLGYRGSINWSFNADNSAAISHLRVFRMGDDAAYTYGYNAYSQAYSSASQAASFFFINSESGITGSTLTNQRTQAGLNVQIPFYTAFKYYPCLPSSATRDVEADTSFNHFALEVCTNSYDMPAGSNGAPKIWSYVGAGTDYSVVQFLFCPVFYIYSGAPVPV